MVWLVCKDIKCFRVLKNKHLTNYALFINFKTESFIKTKPTLMVRQGWEKIAMKKKNYR